MATKKYLRLPKKSRKKITNLLGARDPRVCLRCIRCSSDLFYFHGREFASGEVRCLRAVANLGRGEKEGERIWAFPSACGSRCLRWSGDWLLGFVLRDTPPDGRHNSLCPARRLSLLPFSGWEKKGVWPTANIPSLPPSPHHSLPDLTPAKRRIKIQRPPLGALRIAARALDELFR